MTNGSQSKLRNVQRKTIWIGVAVAVLTALSLGIVRALPGVAGIQTVENAKIEHKEIRKEVEKVDLNHISNDKYDGDHIVIKNRVQAVEESDKHRQEQLDKMDKRQWEMLNLMRQIKNGR